MLFVSATMTLPCQHMVPKMDKFCWTFDLDKGVKYGAMFLMGCWILYAIIAASCGIGESESLRAKVWPFLFLSSYIKKLLSLLDDL